MLASTFEHSLNTCKLYLYIYVCMYVYVCMCMCVCIHIYIYTLWPSPVRCIRVSLWCWPIWVRAVADVGVPWCFWPILTIAAKQTRQSPTHDDLVAFAGLFGGCSLQVRSYEANLDRRVRSGDQIWSEAKAVPIETQCKGAKLRDGELCWWISAESIIRGSSVRVVSWSTYEWIAVTVQCER